MNTHADVLVIGGGAVGVCSAYYASKQGLKVTLLDKGEVCSGGSYGNAGLIVPSHCVPLAAPSSMTNAWRRLFTPHDPIYVKPRLNRDLISWLLSFRRACTDANVRTAMPLLRRLSLASVTLFEELKNGEGLSFGYEKSGYLRLYKTEAGLQEGRDEVELVQSVGVEAQLLDREQVQQLEPSTRIDALGGVSYPEDAHLTPGRFVRGLAERTAKQGVQVLPFTEVLDFETLNRSISKVRTSKGDFVASQIVLAAGAWSPTIAKHLGMRLPIEGAKGYSFTFKKNQQWPALPFSLGEAGVAVTSMGDTLRISGTFAVVGLDLSWDRKRMRAMLDDVTTYLPELQPHSLELLEVWRGLRPCSPDGLPFLGRSRKFENLIVAAGHSMIGVSLSPITGKLVSEIVTRQQPSIDITALQVERFD